MSLLAHYRPAHSFFTKEASFRASIAKGWTNFNLWCCKTGPAHTEGSQLFHRKDGEWDGLLCVPLHLYVACFKYLFKRSFTRSSSILPEHKSVQWVNVACAWETDAISAGQKKATTLPICFEDEGMFLLQLYAVTASMESETADWEWCSLWCTRTVVLPSICSRSPVVHWRDVGSNLANCVVVPGAELEARLVCLVLCWAWWTCLTVVLHSMVLGEIGNWHHFYGIVIFILVFQLVKVWTDLVEFFSRRINGVRKKLFLVRVLRCWNWEVMAGPWLEVFKVRLDGTLSSLYVSGGG